MPSALNTLSSSRTAADTLLAMIFFLASGCLGGVLPAGVVGAVCSGSGFGGVVGSWPLTDGGSAWTDASALDFRDA